MAANAGLWASSVGEVVGFVDSIWYSEQEREQVELARQGLDVQRETLATQERLAEQQGRTTLIASSQATRRASTLAVAGVAAVGLIVVGVVVAT